MSFGSENPEIWDELQTSAIRRWLVGQYALVHGDDDFKLKGVDVEEGIFGRMAEVFFQEHPAVRDAILAAGAEKLVDFSEYIDKFVR